MAMAMPTLHNHSSKHLHIECPHGRFSIRITSLSSSYRDRREPSFPSYLFIYFISAAVAAGGCYLCCVLYGYPCMDVHVVHICKICFFLPANGGAGKRKRRRETIGREREKRKSARQALLPYTQYFYGIYLLMDGSEYGLKKYYYYILYPVHTDIRSLIRSTEYRVLG